VLLIGGMVMGPEFSPLAGIALGLVHRHRAVIRHSVRSLTVGFAIATVLTIGFCLALRGLGWADVGDLLAERSPGSPTFMEVNLNAENALATMPKPTIAYIEGDCIGGGCAIAIDCDLRIAVDGARFGITPAKLCVVYPARSIERVGQLLGPAAAKQLLFTGRLIDTATALRIGLVGEVHTADGAPVVLDDLCAELAQRSLLSQASSKEMLAAVAAGGSVPAGLEAHWTKVAADSGDLREGVAAFAERRPPKFTWPD